MMIEGQKFYPGEMASPQQTIQLADEYRLAAGALFSSGRRGQPLSRAPFRMVTIHAIELYLNALLAAAGYPSTQVRGMQHDLAARTELALKAGLCLRKLTVRHLKELSRTREFLCARYEPEVSKTTELTRLNATLNELAQKVPIWISSKTGQNQVALSRAL